MNKGKRQKSKTKRGHKWAKMSEKERKYEQRKNAYIVRVW